MRKVSNALIGAAFAAAFSFYSFPAAAADLLVKAEQANNQQAQKQLLQQQNQAAGRLFEELELSNEQRVSCQAVVRNGYEINRELRRQAREVWHDLMAALRKPTTTLEDAMIKQRELAKLQNLLAEKRLETWFAVRKLLTPEQLDRLSSLKTDSTLWLEDYGEPRSVKRRNDVP